MSVPVYQGIISPLVTPLDEDKQVDFDGLERLVDRLIAGGVQGLFALGTTGEGPSLPHDNFQQQVIAAVCDQVAGRLPVFVGITSTVESHSLEIAEAAYAAGAACVVLAPPFYMPMTQSELLRYSERLVQRLPLPVMLYNMPGCCKTWFEADTVCRLSQMTSVLGLKDSSADLGYLKTVIAGVANRPDFSILVGPEEILVDAMRIGAHGGVHGGANIFPRLYVQTYKAAVENNWTEAERLQQLVLTVSQTIYSASDGPSRIIKGIKSALQLMGICQDFMAEPFERHTDEARGHIKVHLRRLQAQLGSLASVPQQDVAVR